MTTHIEFALMIDHEDGKPVEVVPAMNRMHAARMAETVYAGRSTWTVDREVQPWRYATQLADAPLSDVEVRMVNA